MINIMAFPLFWSDDPKFLASLSAEDLAAAQQQCRDAWLPVPPIDTAINCCKGEGSNRQRRAAAALAKESSDV